MDRRDFLRSTGLALGAGVLSGSAPATHKPALAQADTGPAAPPDLSSWDTVRRQFNLAADRSHLSGFFLTSHPTPVREAIERHRRGLDDNPYEYVEKNIATFERAIRDAAAGYLACSIDDLCMTDSTSMGIGLVYAGVKLAPDQEILTTVHDHSQTVWALRYRTQRSGTKVRTVSLFQDSATVTPDALTAALLREVRPETGLLALTWVHSNTGVKLPIKRIADGLAAINRDRAPDRRVLLSVDGVHGFGIENVTAADLGCDFFMAGCHKWLFGPRGTGIVYGSQVGWAAMVPTISSFDMMFRVGLTRDQLPMASAVTPGGFHSFEHRWALGEAFAFHQQIGKARVAARVHELNRHCKEGLAAMAHVKVATPLSDEVSAGIICFNVEGRDPHVVSEHLMKKGIVAGVSPYTFKCVRFSPGILNTPDEIDRALREVRALAS